MADQCPDCGATFRPGEAACPECGLELDDDDSRAETDCQCPVGEPCPCEADGSDGLCRCCRDGDHRGSCLTPARGED
jgi:hypothetical protein